MEIVRHRDSESVFDFVSADDFEITLSDDDYGTVSYTSAIRGQSTGRIYKSRMHLDFTVENGTVYFFNETEEDIE